MIETVNYGNQKTILIAPELAFTIGVIVDSTGVSAGSDGKKILKAGTPVGNATSVLENRKTVLSSKQAASQEESQGVLLHDVDVTSGKGNGTLVVAGVVDLTKIDEDAMPDATAISTMKRIIFMKGE